MFNLMLVALIGIILRYKIAFSLPFIDQKSLLHAHSHFAFAGWVTQALMALLINYLSEINNKDYFKKYQWILYGNLITAYGMLFTFSFFGYTFPSILFSTLSVFTSYFFAVHYWRDLNKLKTINNSIYCFKTAVIFNALSSLGPFSLAYMMASKNIHTNGYLASVYFFLHFQYNGWFFFACLGLLSHQLIKYGAAKQKLNAIYWLFTIACVPAYFLSALWLPIPEWLYTLIIIAVFLQLAGWVLLLNSIKTMLVSIKNSISKLSQRLFLLCAIACTIKFCLQSASVIPSLSKLAFGFRPIVIGYLHLVLLAIITLFILAYIITFQYVQTNTSTIKGAVIFTIGIIINEVLLMLQGVADIGNQELPFINPSLLAAALVLFSGMLMINYGQRISKDDPAHKFNSGYGSRT
ncbi:MAG: hypothetical protein ABI687_11075 [Flavitalea sp.]